MQRSIKKSFSAKLSIAPEEIDEASFWLEIISELKLIKVVKFTLLLDEAKQLTKILGASRRTSIKLLINN